MSSLNLKIQEIKRGDFQSYIKTKRDSVVWFYWHLNSSLINFKTYKIIDQNQIIGVLSIEKSIPPFVDIYSDKEYRRQGYGSSIIKYITMNYGKVKFKVNLNNKKSIDFFEKLLTQNIINHKQIERNYIEYNS